MHNRRKFIIQTSLATAAMTLLKPLKSVAITPTTVSFTSQKISILNVAGFYNNGLSPNIDFQMIDKLQATLQKENCHSLFVATGNIINQGATRAAQFEQLYNLQKSGVEVVLHGYPDLATGEAYDDKLVKNSNIRTLSLYNKDNINDHLLPYHVIVKGNIRTGIIGNENYKQNLKETALRVNQTAAFLKEKKACNLIVLIQSNNHTGDIDQNTDISLARLTSNVNILVSPYKVSKNLQTYIAQNSDQHEIIVSFAAIDNAPAQRVELVYNDKMEKINMNILPVV